MFIVDSLCWSRSVPADTAPPIREEYGIQRSSFATNRVGTTSHFLLRSSQVLSQGRIVSAERTYGALFCGCPFRAPSGCSQGKIDGHPFAQDMIRFSSASMLMLTRKTRLVVILRLSLCHTSGASVKRATGIIAPEATMHHKGPRLHACFGR